MARRREEGNLARIYSECWKYMACNRNYFLFIAVLFFFSIILGLVLPVFFLGTIKQFMEDIVSRTDGMGLGQLFVFILQNNITTSFVGMALGVAFGIVPLFYSFFNGYVLGFVMGKTAAVLGGGVFLRLLPHGIFEIPAILISLGLGLKLGMFVFEKKGKGKKKKSLGKEILSCLKVFVLIVIPLLIIAAFIEAGLIILLG